MTDTALMAPIDEVVADYFATWNEADPGRRRAVIAATWTADATYLDPLFAAEGREALDAMVETVHTQFPGYRFRLLGVPDVHHDRARWRWELAGPDGGPPAAAGIDFATLAPDGKLREVIGFLEQPAPSA